MGGLFSGLHIGYSGLNSSQVGINTTGHNISNAETDGYTRQRVVIETAEPIGNVSPGAVGNGARVQEIVRIHDEFVYKRMVDADQKKEKSDFMRQTMEEVSTFFPEIDNVGIKNDLSNYFDAWTAVAQNPNDSSQKVALGQSTTTLTNNMQDVRLRLTNLQDSINGQMVTAVDDINRMGSQISKLNASIREIESTGRDNANDLRDRRDQLEHSLAKLVDVNVSKYPLRGDANISTAIAESDSIEYHLNIAGQSFVDGVTFHPLKAENGDNPRAFYLVNFESQDGSLNDITPHLRQGKIGGMLDLRGSTIDKSTGNPTSGILQETINKLDAFAVGLIESTNNIYAKSASSKMISNQLEQKPSTLLPSSSLNITAGSFDVVMYNGNAKEVGRRTINIAGSTSMENVVAQMNNSGVGSDDNSDNNGNNDIDDLFSASFLNGTFQIDPKAGIEEQGYTIAITNDTTNFAGSTGINGFFDGKDAKSIKIRSQFIDDPTTIKSFGRPEDGDNEVANDMLELQFQKMDFPVDQTRTNETLYGYFDVISSDVATKTDDIQTRNDTFTAQSNSIQLEYESVSKVNVDEELVNLIKYQTHYGAAAKVISTIDQMMQTLLGLKQ